MKRTSSFFVLLLLAGCSATHVAPAPANRSTPPSPATPTAPPPAAARPALPPPSPQAAPPQPATRTTTFHARFAAAARRALARGNLDGPRGRRPMRCTGLVQACFDRLECEDRPKGSTRALHAWCVASDRMVEEPAPGDLVFFDDTWDRDDDGRRNDSLTHVGVVVDIDSAGRVHFIHVGSRKIKEGVLDREHPGDRRDASGAPLNSPLRVRRRRDPRGTRYLAGQLLRGFCRPAPCGSGEAVVSFPPSTTPAGDDPDPGRRRETTP